MNAYLSGLAIGALMGMGLGDAVRDRPLVKFILTLGLLALFEAAIWTLN